MSARDGGALGTLCGQQADPAPQDVLVADIPFSLYKRNNNVRAA